MIGLALLLQPIPGVVDRIDGDHAAIEWDGGPVVPVPLDRLPADVCEGSVVRLRARRGPGGEPATDAGDRPNGPVPGDPLPIPLEVVPRGWRAAAAKGTPVRWTITVERT